MNRTKPLLGVALVAIALVIAPPVARAARDNYPNRPIRFIAPIPAGGSTDVLTRDIARRLQERWGQPTVVENKLGGTAASARRWWHDHPPTATRCFSWPAAM